MLYMICSIDILYKNTQNSKLFLSEVSWLGPYNAKITTTALYTGAFFTGMPWGDIFFYVFYCKSPKELRV